jgi:hypothetical protein
VWNTVTGECERAGNENGFRIAVFKIGGTMSGKILSRSFSMIAFLVAVLLIAPAGIYAAPQEDNKEVTKLLEDIKSQAYDLKRDSDELEAYARSDVSWESHATQLEMMKERINTIGKTIARLQGLRSSASPWQQEAIDRIVPVAQKLASNTSAAIDHLNKDRLKIHEPQYQQYVKSNAEAATNLATLVKDFVEYGKTRTTLEAYERKLEVSQ